MANSISGKVFLDNNADGLINGTDSGLSGQAVSLTNASGSVVATTTTDGYGNYAFAAPSAGTYTVKVASTAGANFSATANGGSRVNGSGAVTVVAGNADVARVDAGEYIPAMFTGTVFTDANGNGLVDGNDCGLGGVTVQLLNAQAQPSGVTTTTAANGTYSFNGLAPGTYSAHVVLPNVPPGVTYSQMGSNTTPQPTGSRSGTANNLLVNGSFEGTTNAWTTANGFSGWTLSGNTAATPYGSGPGNGAEITATSGTSAGQSIDPKGYTNPYAGRTGSDNANPNYTGGSGAHAAFFVDDGAIETLSQSVSLTAGQVYEVGFDLNETTPGQNNPGFFSLTASLGGQTITTASSTSGTKLVPGTWTHFADLFTPTASGVVTLTFTYASGTPGSSLASKDVLVDDVYVVPGQVTQTLTTTSEVDPHGNTMPVTLGSGQTVGNESAGIYSPPATISGTVFTDLNADGVREAGDPGLAGVTVNLATNGIITATTVTDASGAYSFVNQQAGTYAVTVVAPGGSSVAAPGSSTTQTDSTVSTKGVQTVSVASGGAAVVNAGLYKPGTITGTVFADANADGVKQSGDLGIGGQTVTLIGAGGKAVATTTTAADGTYRFSNQLPGSYTVQVSQGSAAISPAGSSATLTGSTVGANGAQAITLASGGTVVVNAGEYAPSTIAGTVYDDANADCIQQPGDVGLAGQMVNLLDATGGVVATTLTGADGSYRFTDLAPGNDIVQVIAKAGDQFAMNDGTTPVTVTSGSGTTVNVGEYAPSVIAGTVYDDANADCIKQPGDVGLAGQTVNLLDETGSVIATTLTGADGSYRFTDLAPGNDIVQVIAKAGDQFAMNDGTTPVTVTSGSGTTVNVGEYAPSVIAGTVYDDANADCIQQAGDVGLAGQTVNLLDETGSVIATTLTGADGSYRFTDLAPGNDIVQVIAKAGDQFAMNDGTTPVTVTSGSGTTVNVGEYAPSVIAGTVYDDANADCIKQPGDVGLAGQTVNLLDETGSVIATTLTGADGSYRFTDLAPGNDIVQVIAKAGDQFAMNDGTTPVTVTSGSGTTVNVGEYAPSVIAGTVYDDANADCIQQAGDVGLAGQTVNLLDETGSVIATTLTGADGSYRFTDLAPGNDIVQVIAKAGDQFAMNDGTTPVTVTSGSGTTVNVGEYAPSVIAGTVYDDANADCIKQPGDVGLAGQTVNLLDETGSVIATTLTGADGSYRFTDLAPGNDIVQVIAKAGDQFAMNDGTTPVTVTSGSGTTVNVGEYAPSVIAGTVYDDANADCIKQPGDVGLAGQTVNLLDETGSVIATTLTGADGSYRFTDLAPGNDIVQVIAKAGDQFAMNDGTTPVTVTSGSGTTVNVGEYAPSVIAGTVYDDANADCIQQAGDVGLAGQTVNLLDETGSVIATTLTGADGSYRFTDLAPGNDIVQVIAKAGDQFAMNDGTTPVTVTSGSGTTVNVGEYAPSVIAGTVYDDANADCIQQAGDVGLAGQTVNLLDETGSVIATTLTGADGSYRFTDLAPGNDVVQVIAKAGDVFSMGDGATPVTVTSGSATTVDAGEHGSAPVLPATITGRAFVDAHGSGLDDYGDPAFAGVTVKLLDGTGHDTGHSTVTDASGNYSFTNLAPGAYQVQFALPPGTAFTHSHAGTGTGTNDSDADPATGRTEVFTLAPGETDGTRNAGLLLTGGYTDSGTVVTGGTTHSGGSGDTIIIAGPGTNTIESGQGNNLIIGGTASYTQAQGLGGNDFVFGSAGNGILEGHAGNEYFAAGTGNQTLVGGGGHNVFIANRNDGTITEHDGAFTGISGGDTFVTHGTTDSIYVAGDGVLTISDYDPAAGDTLHVYGYDAPAAIGQSGGNQVLYFGQNAAILLRNSAGMTVTGLLQGVSFSTDIPTAPLLSVAVNAANALTLSRPGDSTPLIGPGDVPTIAGATAGQRAAAGTALTPFSGLVIADTLAGQTETVRVTPFAPGGSFSHTGDGRVTDGVFTVTGTAGSVTATLDGLQFTPALGTTSFGITVTDTAGRSSSDATTTVIAAAPTTPTAITIVAVPQTDPTHQHAFAGVTVTGPDNGNETVTATLANPAAGTLSNLGNGTYDAARGVYTTTGTAAATTANLDQVIFTPASGAAAGFTIAAVAADGSHATAAGSFTPVTPVAPASQTLPAAVVPVHEAVPVTTPSWATTAGATTAGAITLDAGQSGTAGGGTEASVHVTGVGNDTVTLGNGDDTVILSGYGNSVTVGDGDNTVAAGEGNATVHAGNGRNTITAGGYGSIVTVGTGNDTITAGSNVSITAAGGNQTITLDGYGNMVFIGGSGSSTITGGFGSSHIMTTGGTASITLAGYDNVVTTGGANDTIHDGTGGTHFLIGPTQAGLTGGAQIIAGFQPSSLIDLINGAGDGWNPAELAASLKAVPGGVKLDLGGSGGSVTFLGLTPEQLPASNFQVR